MFLFFVDKHSFFKHNETHSISLAYFLSLLFHTALQKCNTESLNISFEMCVLLAFSELCMIQNIQKFEIERKSSFLGSKSNVKAINFA